MVQTAILCNGANSLNPDITVLLFHLNIRTTVPEFITLRRFIPGNTKNTAIQEHSYLYNDPSPYIHFYW